MIIHHRRHPWIVTMGRVEAVRATGGKKMRAALSSVKGEAREAERRLSRTGNRISR